MSGFAPIAKKAQFKGLGRPHGVLIGVLLGIWLGVPQRLGKRKHTPPCSAAELFFAKKWGQQMKDFGGRYAFLVFRGLLCLPPVWKVFSLKPEKFSKRFSFGGGSVRFFLLCKEFFLSVFGRFFPKSAKTLWGNASQMPKSTQKALCGGRFPARAPRHSCKWRPGSQP